jgi:hypothetical protein
MPGATYVLDKTYKETDAAGVGRFRAVTFGTNDGECKLPAAANNACAGITQEAQSKQNENVAVRVLGISRAYANGSVTKGDWVEIAGTAGDLKTAVLTAGTYTVHNVVGQALTSAASGEIFFVLLAPGPCVQAAS